MKSLSIENKEVRVNANIGDRVRASNYTSTRVSTPPARKVLLLLVAPFASGKTTIGYQLVKALDKETIKGIMIEETLDSSFFTKLKSQYTIFSDLDEKGIIKCSDKFLNESLQMDFANETKSIMDRAFKEIKDNDVVIIDTSCILNEAYVRAFGDIGIIHEQFVSYYHTVFCDCLMEMFDTFSEFCIAVLGVSTAPQTATKRLRDRGRECEMPLLKYGTGACNRLYASVQLEIDTIVPTIYSKVFPTLLEINDLDNILIRADNNLTVTNEAGVDGPDPKMIEEITMILKNKVKPKT
jgi:hypothetical protein